jgi:hypothetical protein
MNKENTNTMKMEMKTYFDAWIADGNVSRLGFDCYATQDHGYRNRLTFVELQRYFIKLYNE